MKLFVDASAGRRLASALRDAGHDVVFSRDLGPDPGDAELVRRAATENRTVITVDRNFGRSIILGAAPNTGIVFIPDVLFDQRLELVETAVTAHETDLNEGAWVVSQPGGMRLRMPSPSTDDE